jgi:hypothetical protein
MLHDYTDSSISMQSPADGRVQAFRGDAYATGVAAALGLVLALALGQLA